MRMLVQRLATVTKGMHVTAADFSQFWEDGAIVTTEFYDARGRAGIGRVPETGPSGKEFEAESKHVTVRSQPSFSPSISMVVSHGTREPLCMYFPKVLQKSHICMVIWPVRQVG